MEVLRRPIPDDRMASAVVDAITLYFVSGISTFMRRYPRLRAGFRKIRLG